MEDPIFFRHILRSLGLSRRGMESVVEDLTNRSHTALRATRHPASWNDMGKSHRLFFRWASRSVCFTRCSSGASFRGASFLFLLRSLQRMCAASDLAPQRDQVASETKTWQTCYRDLTFPSHPLPSRKQRLTVSRNDFRIPYKIPSPAATHLWFVAECVP